MNRRTIIIGLFVASSYSLATVLLLVLKLAGAIRWPWLWIIAPLWLPMAAIGAIAAGLAVFALIDRRSA